MKNRGAEWNNFSPNVRDQKYIYAYTEEQYEDVEWKGERDGKGLIKIGDTTDLERRMKEHYPTNSPNDEKDYKILYYEKALKENGDTFLDHEIHKKLVENGVHRITPQNRRSTEWFECTVDDLKKAMLEVKQGLKVENDRHANFKMRPEQDRAVKLTQSYFQDAFKKGEKPHFLWNAKMRFGKTFSSYQLAKKMGFTKIMVLSYKPAVSNEWRRDLMTHVDFEGWQFYTKDDDIKDFNLDEPLCWFASFQDALGRTQDGKLKTRFKEAIKIDWDCIILDEYHFGAHNENSKKQFHPDFIETDVSLAEAGASFSEETFPFHAKSFLYLSGTPFKSIRDGEFLENEIFTWTYIDEQEAKNNWKDDQPNPYLELPEMIIMSYELPPEVMNIAKNTDTNEFALNEFFKAKEIDNDGKKEYVFEYENEVQKWLTFIKGQYTKGGFRPDMKNDIPTPFGNANLENYLAHTFWLLPRVYSCYAMEALLKRNNFFDEYKIITAAGERGGSGNKAVIPVIEAIGKNRSTKTITLSCGKLTQGVTVKQWNAVFMLSDIKSPESYFQSAFRAQNPDVIKYIDNDGQEIHDIQKEKCYVFEFSPNRTLRLITEYAVRLNPDSEYSHEQKIQEFLNFLPVLAYEGDSMYLVDAKQALDFSYSGIGMSMLAERWKSRLLVNVNNDALERLMEYPEIIEALENMDDFVNLNDSVSKLITSEKRINKLKREGKKLSESDKKEEKKNKSQREKWLNAFRAINSKIPIFMYLTDFREEALKDVITKLEPDLFYKVTGIEVGMFKILCDIGVLSASYMDQSIFKFRQAEESSLSYAGLRSDSEYIGGFDQQFRKEIVFDDPLLDDLDEE